MVAVCYLLIVFTIGRLRIDFQHAGLLPCEAMSCNTFVENCVSC